MVVHSSRRTAPATTATGAPASRGHGIPSRPNATAQTCRGSPPLECGIGFPTGVLLRVSQSWATPSSLPVKARLPSGLNATARTGTAVRQGVTDRHQRVGVPKTWPAVGVVSADENGLAIRAETRCGEHRSVLQNGPPALARRATSACGWNRGSDRSNRRVFVTSG